MRVCRISPAALGVVTALLLAGPAGSAADPWLVKSNQYRVTLTVEAGPYQRVDHLVRAALTRAQLEGVRGYLDVSSLTLFESKEDGPVSLPCDYSEGKLVFRLTGRTPPLTSRVFHLYFNLLRRPSRVVERRGAAWPADVPFPGDNLVANASFEEPILDATGKALTVAQVHELEHTNLVPDPGLESGEWDLPAPSTDLQIALEQGAGRNASVGLVIKADGSNPGSHFEIRSRRFPVKPRAGYQPRLWRWLDQTPTAGRIRPVLVFLDEQGKPVSDPVDVHTLDKPDAQWHAMTFTGWSPEQARFGQIQIRGDGLSEVRCVFDDFEVFERINPPGWFAVLHPNDPGMEAQIIEGERGRALRLRTSELGRHCTVAFRSRRFPIKPNTAYVGGCLARPIVPGAKAAFSFAAFDENGKPAMDTWNVFMGNAAAVPGEWSATQNGGRTKPNAAWGEVSVSLGWGQGEVWFDDIFLREASSGGDVKVTLGKLQKKSWFGW